MIVTARLDAIHASADGQKFEAKRETFKTRYSSKYFGTQKGVSAMSMIANHTAINARVIGANEHESHYIFDLLYSNTSEIQPDVLSTDTHGVNVSGARFRGNSDDEIQLWNECARLVTNAIIYFNSNILSRLLISFEQHNDDEKLAIVTQASPVAWHNINLKGRYSFESTDRMPDLDEMMQHIEGYRPVR